MSARYLARRLAQVPPTLAGLLGVAFLLIHLAPGDPVLALAGEHGDPGFYETIRVRFGLDRPVPERLGAYVWNVVRGDLGMSFVHGRSVSAVLAERLPATLLLMGTALGLSTGVGILIGTLAARSRGAAALVLQAAAVIGHATPSFWLAQMALIVVAVSTGLFPLQGLTDPRRPGTGLGHVLDVLHHLALPALVLAAHEVALVARLVRAGLGEAMASEYVRTARAKGLPERSVVRHALRNVLLPVVTAIGGRLGTLCSGAVLVEIVFGWPGLGRLLLASVQARDYPVLLGAFLLVSATVVLANLFTDLVYARLDPRIRYG